MYAVIAAGAKQFKVSKGETIYIDKVNAEENATLNFEVLMLGSEDGIKVGTPVLSGAKVEGKVVKQVKGEKIRVFKYKSKKNYRKTRGHRQQYTKVEITSITA